MTKLRRKPTKIQQALSLSEAALKASKLLAGLGWSERTESDNKQFDKQKIYIRRIQEIQDQINVAIESIRLAKSRRK